jgi:hypothetical protein
MKMSKIAKAPSQTAQPQPQPRSLFTRLEAMELLISEIYVFVDGIHRALELRRQAEVHALTKRGAPQRTAAPPSNGRQTA